MKQKWFSPRLYVEGLRQLRLMGILFTAAVGLIVVFIPLVEYINWLDSSREFTANTVGYLQMNPLIVGAFCIVAPFLTLNLFSFINKREASDYYHAIPATRTCLFFSFFAAVVTWLFIFVVGTGLLSVVCHAILPQLFIINFQSVLQISLNCFVGGLLVAACVAISMSATGTLIMNVLLALLIIFLPRVLMKLVLTGICEAFPLVDGLAFAPLFNTQYNIPAGYILQYFFYGDNKSVLTSGESCLYTLLLALVYVAIAWWLFVRRRSEGAGHSAPTPKLQALYRFLVGFTISSFVTLALYFDYDQYYGLSDMIGWIFLYIMTVFAMVVFEILCTRRWKGLIRRCALTVLLLVIANAALVSGLFGADTLLRTYSPDVDEIASIRVVEFKNYDDGYSDDNYFTEQSASVNLTDPAILKMVSRQLHHTLDVLDISENKYYEESYQASSLVVSIKSGGISHLRRIIVYDDDVELLAEKLAENKQYQDIYMNLPTNYSHIRATGLYLTTDNGAKQLLDTLQAEVKEIGFEKWYALLNGGSLDAQFAEKYNDVTYESPLTSLSVYVPNVSGWVSYSVPLYPEILPKTAAAYLELHKKNAADQQEQILDMLINHIDDCDYMDVTVHNTTVDSTNSPSFWWDIDTMKKNREAIVDFVEALKRVVDEPIDPTQPLCYISISCRVHIEQEYTNYYEYTCFEGYFAIPEDTVIPIEEDQYS